MADIYIYMPAAICSSLRGAPEESCNYLQMWQRLLCSPAEPV